MTFSDLPRSTLCPSLSLSFTISETVHHATNLLKKRYLLSNTLFLLLEPSRSLQKSKIWAMKVTIYRNYHKVFETYRGREDQTPITYLATRDLRGSVVVQQMFAEIHLSLEAFHFVHLFSIAAVHDVQVSRKKRQVGEGAITNKVITNLLEASINHVTACHLRIITATNCDIGITSKIRK